MGVQRISQDGASKIRKKTWREKGFLSSFYHMSSYLYHLNYINSFSVYYSQGKGKPFACLEMTGNFHYYLPLLSPNNPGPHTKPATIINPRLCAITILTAMLLQAKSTKNLKRYVYTEIKEMDILYVRSSSWSVAISLTMLFIRAAVAITWGEMCNTSSVMCHKKTQLVHNDHLPHQLYCKFPFICLCSRIFEKLILSSEMAKNA